MLLHFWELGINIWVGKVWEGEGLCNKFRFSRVWESGDINKKNNLLWKRHIIYPKSPKN